MLAGGMMSARSLAPSRSVLEQSKHIREKNNEEGSPVPDETSSSSPGGSWLLFSSLIDLCWFIGTCDQGMPQDACGAYGP